MHKRTGWASAAVLLALTSGTAAQAQSEADYCAGLRQLIVAADEAPPFASIMRGVLRGERHVTLANGWMCARDDRDQRRLYCNWDTESRHSVRERLAAGTARCLPAATPSGLSPYDTRFRLGRHSIYLHNEILASGPGSGVVLSVGPFPAPGE